MTFQPRKHLQVFLITVLISCHVPRSQANPSHSDRNQRPRRPLATHLIRLRCSAPMAAPTSPASPAAGLKAPLPTMGDIMAASRAQGLHVRLRTAGPFFRVTATCGEEGEEDAAVELGRAEGGVRPWPGGAVLHLDSMRMTRATLRVSDRPLFGLGMFLGAVAVRHGFDAGCKRAELLAINDTPLYHDKLVRFYTRMGFKAVREVDGSSITDLAHMLVWGGRGTRMDADIEELLIKWGKRFRPRD